MFYSVDYALFKFFNNVSASYAGLILAVVFCAVYLLYLEVALAFGLWLFVKEKLVRQGIIIGGVSALVSRVIVTELIRLMYARPRPFTVHVVHQLIEKDTEPSFPSGHASFMFALGFGIYFYNRPLGILFLVLALLTGVARVMAGVHYPFDIFGGAVVGLVVAWLVDRYGKHWVERFTA